MALVPLSQPLLLTFKFLLLPHAESELLWGDSFYLTLDLVGVCHIWHQWWLLCLVGFEIVHDIDQVTYTVVELDEIILALGCNHLFKRTLELVGVTEQVKNKGEVNVRQVDEILFFLPKSLLEVILELPAVEPRIVDWGCDWLWCQLVRLKPSVALDHAHAEIIQGVHGVTRVFKALFALVVLIKSKAIIESLYVVKDSRLRKFDIAVDVFLKLLKFGAQLSLLQCVSGRVMRAILHSWLL